jgi:nucleoside-diphosphate-sugar epimerase
VLAKRVLITGAAGFVGAGLTRSVLAAGHDVHVLLRAGRTPWRLAEVTDDVQRHEIDLRDEQAVRALVERVRPEWIYHLATHGAYPSQADAERIIQTNVLGTWNLLKAASSVDYDVFVNTGSSSEYGFKETVMRETDLPEPNSYYAVAKCAQTLLCQHVAKAERRPITTLRLFSVYGPFEEPSRLVPTVIRRCLEGQDLTLTAPDTARDFVFIEDVVDAYLRVDALARLSGEIINIGSSVQSTIRDVVELVLRHTGARVACHWGAMPARTWDQNNWVADCAKGARVLGWQARTSLSEGLARTVAWMRERLDTDRRARSA